MLHSSIELRRSDRHPAVQNAELQLPWGRIRRVTLKDISSDGCRIEVDDQLMAVGDAVLIRSSVLCGASGTVMWRGACEAGIAFSGKIDPRVLAQLAELGPTGAKMITSRRQSSGAAPA